MDPQGVGMYEGLSGRRLWTHENVHSRSFLRSRSCLYGSEGMGAWEWEWDEEEEEEEEEKEERGGGGVSKRNRSRGTIPMTQSLSGTALLQGRSEIRTPREFRYLTGERDECSLGVWADGVVEMLSLTGNPRALSDPH